MNGFMRGLLLAALLAIALALAGCGGGEDSDSSGVLAPTAVVQPLPMPGPYTVACSNIKQNFGSLSVSEVERYWEGDGGLYVTDLLDDQANTLIATVIAPSDEDLFGSFAGQTKEFVVLVCYPTTDINPYPDYSLPTGEIVPHMQTGTQTPLFYDYLHKYPAVVFSHGYTGSPISSDDYLLAVTTCASYGYVVIAPFHGDLRFCDLHIEDIEDVAKVVLKLDDFTAVQALRPLAVSAALNLVLNHPQWKDHIDETRIGGFGASMGGETMLLLGGARLTVTNSIIGGDWEFDSKQVTYDPRIKAAAGYVPYFGQSFLPAFGEDQEGLTGISLPFLGISGTADTTAPIYMAESGMSRLTGTRRLVALSGVEHGFDDAFTNDIFTWALTFLDAKVRETAEAISRLNTMGSVAGGGDDSLWLY